MRTRPALLLFLLFTGCLWRGYEAILSVHLDVLSGEANKILDKAAAGQRPSPNDVTEMLYPLQRARQFAGQYASYSGRESYRRFVDLLARYEALAKFIDAARGDPARWNYAAQRLLGQRHAIAIGADRVRAALKAEGR